MNKGLPADVLSCLQRFEQSILSRSSAEEGSVWFNTQYGNRPVLVSAPHACTHERDGVAKMAEEFTAAIALYLAGQTGCHVIYAANRTTEDPNWVSGGEYKKAIHDIVSQHNIRLLIDLHGMTNRYQMGVALGTMLGRSIAVQSVVQPFVDAGFVLTAANDLPEKLPMNKAGCTNGQLRAAGNLNWRRLVVDHPRFTGGVRSQTVTRFGCEVLAIKSLQVELASAARIVHRPKTPDWPYDYSGNPQAIEAGIEALSALIVSHS